MERIFSIALLLTVFATKPTLADSNPTAQGHWSLGGSFSFPYEYNKYRVSSFGFSLRPEASYLPLDGLELTLGLTLANNLDLSYLTPPRKSPLNNLYWGFKIGSRYFFKTNSNIQPYFGAELGAVMVEWQFKQIVWYVKIPTGIMWFIQPNVAIDVGIPLSIDFSSTAIFEKITVNPGYLGIRAFF